MTTKQTIKHRPANKRQIGKLYFEMLACATAQASLNGIGYKKLRGEKLRAMLPDMLINSEIPASIKQHLIKTWCLPKAAELLYEGFGSRFEEYSLLDAINENEASWLIGKFIEIKENDCRDFYSYNNKENLSKPMPILLKTIKKIFRR
jgi:hypothetical protein